LVHDVVCVVGWEWERGMSVGREEERERERARQGGVVLGMG
jgi:hypothetical protein